MYKLLIMKKIYLFLFFGACCFANAVGQDSASEITVSNAEAVPVWDSLIMDKMEIIHNRIENLVPRYKMYMTENIYNLIKLNTATGQLWQVQYGVGDTDALTVSIDNSSLLYSWEPEVPGRFELYPTQNMYNFILIDNDTGKTWQVQWNTSSSKRFRQRIY